MADRSRSPVEHIARTLSHTESYRLAHSPGKHEEIRSACGEYRDGDTFVGTGVLTQAPPSCPSCYVRANPGSAGQPEE